MLNKVILQGRLVHDPELKNLGGDSSACTFSIATQRNFKNKTTGEYEADFFNCVAFSNTGKFISEFFKKGSMIIVEGRLQISKKDDKYYTNVIVQSAQFCDTKKDKESKTQDDAFPF